MDSRQHASTSGDPITGDSVIGDQVAGDKVAGDKVAGDKVIIHQQGYSAKEVAEILESALRTRETTGLPATASEWQQLSFEPETILLVAGDYWLGDDAQPNAAPRHQVSMPTLRIGKTLVTNRQYAVYLQATNQLPPPELAWKGQTPPDEQLDGAVTGVTFQAAVAYCRWLSSATSHVYQLPHEAAWEIAVRAYGVDWGATREWSCTIWGESLRVPDERYRYPWHDDERNDQMGGSHLRRVVRGSDPTDAAIRKSAPPDQPGAPGKRHGFRVMVRLEGTDR